MEGTCMRGELKKKGKGRRGGGGGKGRGSIVACGKELEYSENLGACCNMGTCVPYSEYCNMEMKDGRHVMYCTVPYL